MLTSTPDPKNQSHIAHQAALPDVPRAQKNRQGRREGCCRSQRQFSAPVKSSRAFRERLPIRLDAGRSRGEQSDTVHLWTLHRL